MYSVVGLSWPLPVHEYLNKYTRYFVLFNFLLVHSKNAGLF